MGQSFAGVIAILLSLLEPYYENAIAISAVLMSQYYFGSYRTSQTWMGFFPPQP
jgi:hypothetical protein